MFVNRLLTITSGRLPCDGRSASVNLNFHRISMELLEFSSIIWIKPDKVPCPVVNPNQALRTRPDKVVNPSENQ
jgi:hypothetical protein